MKKVLVTGADGFIGSHLTEKIMEKGYDGPKIRFPMTTATSVAVNTQATIECRF